MLHIHYVGLLNTDHRQKGPVRMFLQGRESQDRYVLDRLPPWVDPCARYLGGTNLDLVDQETRAAFYQSLVAGDYKVRQMGDGLDYRAMQEVFAL